MIIIIWLFSWRGQAFMSQLLFEDFSAVIFSFQLRSRCSVIFSSMLRMGEGEAGSPSTVSSSSFFHLVLFSPFYGSCKDVYPAPGSNGGWGRHGSTWAQKNIAANASGVFIDLALNSVWPLNFIVTGCECHAGGVTDHMCWIEVISTDNLVLIQHYVQ